MLLSTTTSTYFPSLWLVRCPLPLNQSTTLSFGFLFGGMGASTFLYFALSLSLSVLAHHASEYNISIRKERKNNELFCLLHPFPTTLILYYELFVFL